MRAPAALGDGAIPGRSARGRYAAMHLLMKGRRED